MIITAATAARAITATIAGTSRLVVSPVCTADAVSFPLSDDGVSAAGVSSEEGSPDDGLSVDGLSVDGLSVDGLSVPGSSVPAAFTVTLNVADTSTPFSV